MDAEISVTVPSKKALKRQQKREKLTQLKELRKVTRKERRKEKKERQKKPFKNATRKQDRDRLKRAQETGPRLVIDLSLSHLMTEKEIGSLCRQLTIIYVENKKSQQPFHLNFTSFTGAFKDAFEKFSPTYHNWIIDVHEASFLEVFPDARDQMIYLTADASTDMVDLTLEGDTPCPFDKELILIIGGLIDRNRHKNVCYEEAKKHGIRSARLPLHFLEGMNKGLKVLTTNQCAEMLLRYQESLDWRFAVSSIYPKRKLTIKQSPSHDISSIPAKTEDKEATAVEEEGDRETGTDEATRVN